MLHLDRAASPAEGCWLPNEISGRLRPGPRQFEIALRRRPLDVSSARKSKRKSNKREEPRSFAPLHAIPTARPKPHRRIWAGNEDGEGLSGIDQPQDGQSRDGAGGMGFLFAIAFVWSSGFCFREEGLKPPSGGDRALISPASCYALFAPTP